MVKKIDTRNLQKFECFCTEANGAYGWSLSVCLPTPLKHSTNPSTQCIKLRRTQQDRLQDNRFSLFEVNNKLQSVHVNAKGTRMQTYVYF